MKRVLILGLVVFLIVFMFGGINATIVDNLNLSQMNKKIGISSSQSFLDGKVPNLVYTNYFQSLKCNVTPISYDSSWGYTFNLDVSVDKIKLIGLERDNYVDWIDIGNDDIFMKIDIVDIDSFNNKNSSPVVGIFIFKNSQIKGNLVGNIIRSSDWRYGFYKPLIITGNMVGGDYINNTVEYNSIFILAVPNELYNCMLEVDATEVVNVDNEQRISTLESNITLLQSWKQTISDTITNLIAIVTGHTTKIDDYETRITDLENKNYTIPSLPTNFTHPYFKYLSSSNRKAMVCGYAEDNKLTKIIDLGYNCTITYRTSSSGRVTSSCKCKTL